MRKEGGEGTSEGFVPKKVNGTKLLLDVLEAVGLVPAIREHIEAYLAADGKGEAVVCKLLAQLRDQGLAHAVDAVVGLKFVALGHAGIAPDRRHVDHAVAELDEGAALDGDVHVGNLVQDEVGHALVAVFAQPFDEAVAREGLPLAVRRQAVLGEAEIEHVQHFFSPAHINYGSEGRGGGGGTISAAVTQLLLLLGQVAAAHKANRHLVAQRRQNRQHLLADGLPFPSAYFIASLPACLRCTEDRAGRGYPAGGGQGAIDVKQADGVLDQARVKRGELGVH